jgi:RNA polymerase sigma-70 factor, ECF subfamily
MATTALDVNPETVSVDSYDREVEDLRDVIVRHLPHFLRIAVYHLRDLSDAEDAVQDALVSALTHLDQFRGRAKMSTWVTAIVINSARMTLRRRLRQPQIVLGETGQDRYPSLEGLVADDRPDPEEICGKREIAERLAHATSRLSPALRSTFQLRHVEGLSIRETARLLKVPTGTVKARMARARKKLRQVIQKKYPLTSGAIQSCSSAKSHQVKDGPRSLIR